MDFEQRIRYEISTIFNKFHPLMKNYWFIGQATVLGSTVAYLMTVLTLCLIMRRQKPIPENLMKPLVSSYNILQISMNSVIFAITTLSILTRSSFESVFCLPLSPSYESSGAESWGNGQ